MIVVKIVKRTKKFSKLFYTTDDTYYWMKMWEKKGGEVTQKRNATKNNIVRLVRTSCPEGRIRMKNVVNKGENNDEESK